MTRYRDSFKIGNREIGISAPTYFIADIAANHDGDLERAKDLIWLAKNAGADCAKFQHFTAQKIVSDVGFSALANSKQSHQSGWEKSVYEIYDQYHTRRDWTQTLVETCKEAGIEFMTTPYDIDAAKTVLPYVNAVKVGSGDITFRNLLIEIASIDKPILLATGASDINEVMDAVEVILNRSENLCLMQCNTNYTGDLENFKNVNLNVLKSFSVIYPNMPLGLSDHTPGHSAVLGAITLGARVIEKHFTDDNSRTGPDHHFALNPLTWREMVDRARELEMSLGDGIKRIEINERETVVIQRRALRATRDLKKGDVLASEDFEALRPCPEGAVSPMAESEYLDKTLVVDLTKGHCLMRQYIDV
jgi:sialic acid synthase SpsE